MNINYKIVLLGDASVGKTSIAERFLKNVYDEKKTSTIGAAFCCLKIDNIKLNIWDTAGQERFSSIVPFYLRDAMVIMLVFDLSNPKYDNIMHHLRVISMYATNIYKIIIVGNKNDLVTYNTINQIEEKLHTILSDAKNIADVKYISAKTNDNIGDLLQCIVNICKDTKFDITDDIRGFNLDKKNNLTDHYLNEIKDYCSC